MKTSRINQFVKRSGGFSLVEIILVITVVIAGTVLALVTSSKYTERNQIDNVSSILSSVTASLLAVQEFSMDYSVLNTNLNSVIPEQFMSDATHLKKTKWGDMTLSVINANKGVQLDITGVPTQACSKLITKHFNQFWRVSVDTVEVWSHGGADPDPAALIAGACKNGTQTVSFELVNLSSGTVVPPPPGCPVRPAAVTTIGCPAPQTGQHTKTTTWQCDLAAVPPVWNDIGSIDDNRCVLPGCPSPAPPTVTPMACPAGWGGTKKSFQVNTCNASTSFAWQSTTPVIDDQCVPPGCPNPAPDTGQELGCPTGQSGAHTQTRFNTCNASTNWLWGLGSWSDVQNTCHTSCPLPTPSSLQNVGCTLPLTGTWTQSRIPKCDATTGYVWDPASLIWIDNKQCTTPPPLSCGTEPSKFVYCSDGTTPAYNQINTCNTSTGQWNSVTGSAISNTCPSGPVTTPPATCDLNSGTCSLGNGILWGDCSFNRGGEQVYYLSTHPSLNLDCWAGSCAPSSYVPGGSTYTPASGGWFVYPTFMVSVSLGQYNGAYDSQITQLKTVQNASFLASCEPRSAVSPSACVKIPFGIVSQCYYASQMAAGQFVNSNYPGPGDSGCSGSVDYGPSSSRTLMSDPTNPAIPYACNSYGGSPSVPVLGNYYQEETHYCLCW